MVDSRALMKYQKIPQFDRITLMMQIAEFINALMEFRDPYTVRHQWRVTQLANAIAAEWGMGESFADGLRMAALVHDIGKMIVPMKILTKPGKLTEQEINIIKTHPQVGYNTLKRIELPWPVAEIVLQHHERLDGSGYPHGLSDKNILLEAKILAVAEVVDTMISFAPYRVARMSIDEAMKEIIKNKGIRYDPEIVDACVSLFITKNFTFWME